jgi:hypothetical protein
MTVRLQHSSDLMRAGQVLGRTILVPLKRSGVFKFFSNHVKFSGVRPFGKVDCPIDVP